MKRVLLLFTFIALVLAGVASASRDTGACCPAGAAGQAQMQHDGHGKAGGCCAKMADGKGCCTPGAEGDGARPMGAKKACCADGSCDCCKDGVCEMKKQNGDAEHKAGCCAKKADGEARAGCCAKKAGADAKGGCCKKPAPQGARS